MLENLKRAFTRATAAIWAVVGGMCLSGCTRDEGLRVLAFPAMDYERVFDAAVESARQLGMPPQLRDRRSGIIETQARVAGSLLEPWRTDNASLGQALENTLVYQRRRARFEFAPAGSHERASEPVGPEALDLTEFDGDLEVRVWVFLERANVMGVRRNTWSRYLTSTAQFTFPERQSGQPGSHWTPVTRDEAAEHRLLATVKSKAVPEPP